jgi:uncharacterized protein
VKPSVTVTGAGAASAPPDVAVVQVGAECVARHAGEALSQASAAVAAMREIALAAGVAAADLATSGSQLWPDHDHEGRPHGYRAQLSLTVRIRDLAAASELIPALIESAGDVGRLHSTSLVHSDPVGLAALARDAAFADARVRAEQYAELAGLTLGEVLDIVDVAEGQGGPGFFRYAGAARRGGAMPAAALSMPIEAGTDEVAATVSVRWRLA